MHPPEGLKETGALAQVIITSRIEDHLRQIRGYLAIIVMLLVAILLTLIIQWGAW